MGVFGVVVMLFLAVLAAFGTLCALWALFGWMIPNGEEGMLVCRGGSGVTERGLLRRYLMLRGMGLLDCPLIIVDPDLPEPERRRLEAMGTGIELWGAEELLRRLEQERNQIDGTGNGNHPGRDRRCGVSEL